MKNTSEQTKIVLVMGRKGTGKTTWLKNCLEKTQGKKSILVIDTMNKFTDLKSIEIRNADEFLEYITYSEPAKIIYRMNTVNETEIIKVLNLAYQKGNIAIFFDEGDMIFHRSMHPAVREVILRGRNQGTDLIIATLRPYKIHPDLRSQADLLIIFSLIVRDIKALKDEFGVYGMDAAIMELSEHNYIKYDLNNDEVITYYATRQYNRTGKYKGRYERLQKQKQQKEKQKQEV